MCRRRGIEDDVCSQPYPQRPTISREYGRPGLHIVTALSPSGGTSKRRVKVIQEGHQKNIKTMADAAKRIVSFSIDWCPRQR